MSTGLLQLISNSQMHIHAYRTAFTDVAEIIAHVSSINYSNSVFKLAHKKMDENFVGSKGGIGK